LYKISIEVIEDVTVPAVNPLERLSPLDKVSKEFDDIYTSLFINYGFSYYDYIPIQETGRLLIVYPTAFASNVTPFVEWKQEKGFQTILAEYPTATGTGSAALKTYIQNLYNTPESVTFIVLSW
jgi:gingipain R